LYKKEDQEEDQEEEKFYFKPIKQIENSSPPPVINKIGKTTKIESKKLIMLSSGMQVYVESPDTTFSNSNKQSNDINNNNLNTDSRTSDHSVNYQVNNYNFNQHIPPAIGLLDETSSLTTTASNSNSVSDDLKKIKKLYNMRANPCNYCHQNNNDNNDTNNNSKNKKKYYEATITNTLTTTTSENENNSNNSSSLDSINYSSQNHCYKMNNKKIPILHTDSSSLDKNNSFSISSTECVAEFYKQPNAEMTQQPLTKLPNFDFGKNKLNSNPLGKKLRDKIELKILPLKISSSSIILNKMANSNFNDTKCKCCYCANNQFHNQPYQGKFFIYFNN
jgi:hypothetical protein